jgi:cystathionine beta-lyase/cystathionine gamma-synthase
LVTSREEDAEWFRFVLKSAGPILSPFDCFLVMRGIKTLAVRMERHQANAREVLALLVEHPAVRKVLYPGLPDHPGHEIQKRQARGFGAMISFDVGGFDEAKRLLDRLEVLSLAESLGGVETLISHPASMTHASIPPELRAELGITDGMVRVSVGIENAEDLLGDLRRALDAI